MMIASWAKAAAAANPIRILTDKDRELHASRQISLRRVTCKLCSHQPHLLAEIYHCVNPDTYDDSDSDILVLCLEYNANVRDAMENRLLDAFDANGDILQEKCATIEAELSQLAGKSLPFIDRLYTRATRIKIQTMPGSRLEYSISEEDELIFPFTELPLSIISLRLPTAIITTLNRLGPAGPFGLYDGIDRVVSNEQDGVFAFKRAGRDHNATSQEIELLARSPLLTDEGSRTLKVSAVVVDARGRLRGYLSPFIPFGSLEEVFLGQRVLQSLRSVVTHDGGRVVFPRQPVWKDKLRWAAQLARGVATLHDGHPTTGPITLRNLNPRNVLISGSASASSCRDTFLIIAGFRSAASPTGMRFSRRWAAPERLRKSTYEIGTALDVANLGMVLWALAEENFDGFPDIYSGAHRDSAGSTTSSKGGPVPIGRSELWRKDSPMTPGWYRILVESCVEEEPARRPKAAEVASQLERQLQFA